MVTLLAHVNWNATPTFLVYPGTCRLHFAGNSHTIDSCPATRARTHFEHNSHTIVSCAARHAQTHFTTCTPVLRYVYSSTLCKWRAYCTLLNVIIKHANIISCDNTCSSMCIESMGIKWYVHQVSSSQQEEKICCDQEWRWTITNLNRTVWMWSTPILGITRW